MTNTINVIYTPITFLVFFVIVTFGLSDYSYFQLLGIWIPLIVISFIFDVDKIVKVSNNDR
jgi:fatty acid desaturase